MFFGGGLVLDTPLGAKLLADPAYAEGLWLGLDSPHGRENARQRYEVEDGARTGGPSRDMALR